jgi:LysR family transcriptional regulator, nitrogen assimilation regulatory protein
MDFQQLRYFVTVAEHGSFTRAASVLPLAQSALSQQIAALEREFGLALLHRHGRGVNLTEAGQRLLKHAYNVLLQVRETEEDLASLRNNPVGRVTVAICPSLGRKVSAPLMLHCRRLFPDATVSIHEGQSVNILEWLAVGRVDIGIVYAPVPSPDYRTQKIMDLELGLVTSSRSVRSKRHSQTITLRELADHPMVMCARPHAIRRIVEGFFVDSGFPMNIAYEVDQASGIATVCDLVEEGEGSTILPQHVIEASMHRRPTLIRRRVVSPPLKAPLHIALSNHRPRTPLTASVAKVLQCFIPERLNGVSAAVP